MKESIVGKGHGEKLGPRLEEAVEVAYESKSWKEAAEKLGVDEKTFRQWRKDPLFRQRYAEYVSDVFDEGMSELNVLYKKALQLLNAELDSWFDTSARFRAARIILEERQRMLRRLDEIKRGSTTDKAPLVRDKVITRGLAPVDRQEDHNHVRDDDGKTDPVEHQVSPPATEGSVGRGDGECAGPAVEHDGEGSNPTSQIPADSRLEEVDLPEGEHVRTAESSEIGQDSAVDGPDLNGHRPSEREPLNPEGSILKRRHASR